MGKTPRFQIAVDTENGIFIRNVSSASRLPAAKTHGDATETSVITASATWGLKDFVFEGTEIQVGQGTRELGDGLVIAPPYGLVIQVKGRENPTDNPDREKTWLTKKISEANGQVSGTLRQLKATPRKLENLRGTELVVSAEKFLWVGLTIIEHEAIPFGYIPENPAYPGMVLTRADWEFLWEQLKSTGQVIGYLHRVSELPPTELGKESIRYYQLATADAETKPEPITNKMLTAGGTRINGPLLPFEPAGLEIHQFIFRQILEDLASVPIPPGIEPFDLIRAYAAVDAIPVGHRDVLGKAFLERLGMDAAPDTTTWWWRRVSSASGMGPHIVLMTCTSHDSPEIQATFGIRILLIHDDWIQQSSDGALRETVALLLTPAVNEGKPWDATLVRIATNDRLEPAHRKHLELAVGAD